VPTFLEIVVEGPYPLVKGFVWGLMEGSKKNGVILFSRDNNIRTEAFLELLLERTHLHGSLTHLVIGSDLLELVRKGIAETFEQLKLNLRSVYTIEDALFDFEYEVYARKYAEELRRLFVGVALPLRLSPEYIPREEIHEDGESIDAYTPLPAYKLQARGSVSGPIDRLAEFYRMVRAYELIKTGEIILRLER
jgi:hypothetical protein